MISFARYAAVFAHRDLRAAIAASVLGRLPIGITGLSILLLAQRASGSFAASGAMTAAYIAGLASIAPLLGRLIDRSGPRRVLTACAVLFPAALGGLVLSMRVAPSGMLNLALAFAAGASFPPITVCMRTFLRQRLRDEALLGAAYSLESVLIETIFIVGPVLVAVFVAFASAEAAVLLAASCAGLGTILFLRSPAVGRWRVDAIAPNSSVLGPLAERNFGGLLAVILGYSTAFGLVEIGVTAFATLSGRPALAGILLALMSVGSALGGLAYGSRTWGPPLVRQFAIALSLMGIGIALLAPTSNIWLFAILSTVAGVVMAPALTIQSMLVTKTAAPQHATEAFTWSSTGLLSGVGLGMAAGGWLIEQWGWRTTFAAGSIAALSSAALTLNLRLRH